MPVEIRELVIRAVTNVDRPDSADRPEVEDSSPSVSKEQMDAIIHECIRQVLRIMQKEKDR